jgi:hypothetical protein
MRHDPINNPSNNLAPTKTSPLGKLLQTFFVPKTNKIVMKIEKRKIYYFSGEKMGKLLYTL